MRATIFLLVAALLPVCGANAQPTPFQQRALLITDDAVIKDPNRTTNPCAASAAPLQTWSFGALMKQIAGANTDDATVDFIKDWLGKYMAVQTVNGEPVAARDIGALWNGWSKYGWDLRRVPLRLLAILNRIDLLRSPLLAGENGGEVRFVFGGVDLSDLTACSPLNFTVILEYGVRKSSCADLQKWAADWTSLAAWTPGSSSYNTILWPLTDSITMADPNRGKANGSALDHLRTNEAINAAKWELREFRLDIRSGRLMQDTVTLTPRDSLDGSPELAAFLASIDSGIEANPPDYWIPARFPNGNQLLGGMAVAGTAWSTLPDVFATNTCSGCHGGRIPSFNHIDPSGRPSRFLLGELPGREGVLKGIAQNGCTAPLFDLQDRAPFGPKHPPRLVH